MMSVYLKGRGSKSCLKWTLLLASLSTSLKGFMYHIVLALSAMRLSDVSKSSQVSKTGRAIHMKRDAESAD